jgi:glycosyltransferase involved in cell wall biosynthesis/GT2 family glycosyltransferase
MQSYVCSQYSTESPHPLATCRVERRRAPGIGSKPSCYDPGVQADNTPGIFLTADDRSDGGHVRRSGIDQPLVSIIMPVYKKGDTLEESVRCVVAQTLLRWELIVWDDGSPDDLTREAITCVERIGDPRIVVIRAENKGVIAARNAAVVASSGRYLCCLDPDDIIEATYLEKAVTILALRPEFSIVSPYVRLFGDDDLLWRPIDLRPDVIAYDNALPVASVLRRDAFDEVGGFSAMFAENCEDWALWASLAAAGHRSVVLREVLFRYRYSATAGRDAAHRNYDDFQRRMSQMYPGLAAGSVPARSVSDRNSVEITEVSCAFEIGKGRPVFLALPWMTRLGGGEQVARALAEGLRRRGRTVILAAFDPPPPHAVDGSEEAGKATPYHYNLPAIIDNSDYSGFMQRTMGALPAAHIVIIGSNWVYEHLNDLRAWCPGPVSVIDLLFNHIGHLSTSLLHSEQIDAMVPVSKRLGDLLLGYYQVSSSVRPVHVGIDPPHSSPELPEKLARRENLPLCVWLGRHSSEKRPEWFVDAARMFGHLADFAMTSDGEFNESPPGSLQRIGHLEDPSGLVAAADLLVLTSSVEGIPLTVMEAIAVGTPVLCTDVGGIREFVTEGTNAVLVDPQSFETFTATLGRLLADRDRLALLKQSTRAAGFPVGFSTEDMVAGFEAVLTELEAAGGE